MNLQEVKDWLRVDGDDSDNLILGLQLAGEQFLLNAGIQKDYENELYKLAINLLVTHWFENREPTGKADKLAFSLESMIIQLRYCQSGDVV